MEPKQLQLTKPNERHHVIHKDFDWDKCNFHCYQPNPKSLIPN